MGILSVEVGSVLSLGNVLLLLDLHANLEEDTGCVVKCMVTLKYLLGNNKTQAPYTGLHMGKKTKCDTATLKVVVSDVSLDKNCRK